MTLTNTENLRRAGISWFVHLFELNFCFITSVQVEICLEDNPRRQIDGGLMVFQERVYLRGIWLPGATQIKELWQRRAGLNCWYGKWKDAVIMGGVNFFPWNLGFCPTRFFTTPSTLLKREGVKNLFTECVPLSQFFFLNGFRAYRLEWYPLLTEFSLSESRLQIWVVTLSLIFCTLTLLLLRNI